MFCLWLQWHKKHKNIFSTIIPGKKITADNLSVYSQEFEIGQVENSTNDSPAEYSETKVAQSLKS